MKTKIEILQNLASQLPTGLRDPKVLDKLACELEELKEATLAGDTLGAVMEAGDCAYYAVKAKTNGLMTEQERDRFIRNAAGFVALEPEILLDCAIVKYTLRAGPGNPKDNDVERAAVITRITAKKKE